MSKKIYFGAQRELKKTERRPTQTEAWQAHQIRYWGLHEISEKIKQMGIPPPKKFLKEIEKYKNMVINNPEKLDKYYKFIDDKETKLQLEKERIQNEEERLMKEAEKIKEDEKILKNNAATKLQSLFRKRKAMKRVQELREARDEELAQEKEVEEYGEEKTIFDMPTDELVETLRIIKDPKSSKELKREAADTLEMYNVESLEQLEDEYKERQKKMKKKDVTLETLTDKAKSIIYNAIYLVPYEYRKKYEELIPRIKLSKGYEYPRYNENMYKSPDELVPIMDEIYNENDLIANIKNLLYR